MVMPSGFGVCLSLLALHDHQWPRASPFLLGRAPAHLRLLPAFHHLCQVKSQILEACRPAAEIAISSSQMSWWPCTDPWPSWALSSLVLTDVVALISWKGNEAERVPSPSTSWLPTLEDFKKMSRVWEYSAKLKPATAWKQRALHSGSCH